MSLTSWEKLGVLVHKAIGDYCRENNFSDSYTELTQKQASELMLYVSWATRRNNYELFENRQNEKKT